MTTTEHVRGAEIEVWQPCYRAFFVYYVAIFLAVCGPLINPEFANKIGLAPWPGLVIGLVLAGLVAFLKIGQEYRATPRGIVRLSRWPAMEESLSWQEVGEIKVNRGLVQSFLKVGNLIFLDKTGTPRLAWERLADPKAVKEALEARRP